MKIKHNHHGYAPDTTDPEWAERVEREAERHTDQAEVRWNKAKRRLERAEEKARVAMEAGRIGPARMDRLMAEVERRREELRALERLMRQSPAGSQHRGKGSHRGVPRGEVL